MEIKTVLLIRLVKSQTIKTLAFKFSSFCAVQTIAYLFRKILMNFSILNIEA